MPEGRVEVAAAPLVLELCDIAKRFGDVEAVAGVDLALRPGEVVALLGENGAGKTTLMNILFGHVLPDAGLIRVADDDGTLRPLPPGEPRAALDAGIGMVHQHFTLALNLTSFDNIVLGTQSLFAWRRRNFEARATVNELMAQSGLLVDLDARVADLSVGERQRVEILKALYRRARILILDEPTAVLTPQEADALLANLRALAARGLAVVIISHKLREVLAFADRVVVLRAGRVVAAMRAAEADPPTVAAAMIGRTTAPPVRRPGHRPGHRSAPVLDLRNVAVAGPGRALRGASFAVHAGEIVGLAGVSGNGQAALAALLSGLVAPMAGEIRLDGVAIETFTPEAFIRGGIGRIPEDRHRDGVVGTMSVADNLVVERLHDPTLRRLGFLRGRAIEREARRLIQAFDIRTAASAMPARLLSGGNMQKVVLARILDRTPRFILANQPTRGLDVGAAGEVARRLLDARSNGAGVLLIAEDVDEILGLADRVLAIHAGRIVDAGAPARLDRGRLGLLMAGSAA